MGTIASQITSLTSFYSTVYSNADQRKHQSSASLAFVHGIHRGPVNSSHKWAVTRKMFHLMTSSCANFSHTSGSETMNQNRDEIFKNYDPVQHSKTFIKLAAVDDAAITGEYCCQYLSTHITIYYGYWFCQVLSGFPPVFTR